MIYEYKDYEERIKNYEYAFLVVATDWTNTVKFALELICVNSIEELPNDGFTDEDELNEIAEMGIGDTFVNDNYWTILRVK